MHMQVNKLWVHTWKHLKFIYAGLAFYTMYGLESLEDLTRLKDKKISDDKT